MRTFIISTVFAVAAAFSAPANALDLGTCPESINVLGMELSVECPIVGIDSRNSADVRTVVTPAVPAVEEESYTHTKHKSFIGGLIHGLPQQGYSYAGWHKWTKKVVTQEAVPAKKAKYRRVRNGNADPSGHRGGKDNGGAGPGGNRL